MIAANHAIGGAITGWSSINEPRRGALGLGPDVPLPGLRGQVEASLTAGPVDPDVLYILWAGGHDIGNWLEFGQPDFAAESPAQNLCTAAERLIGAGARHIMVVTMPDMGRPHFLAAPTMPQRPLVARIVFRDGDEQEPFTIDDGRIRFAFMEQGEGALIDLAAECTHGAGEILVIPPGAPFGVAAREGGAEGATVVTATVPVDSTLNVPLR